jgi:Fe2+ or Zn2+ uptake regulation protein
MITNKLMLERFQEDLVLEAILILKDKTNKESYSAGKILKQARYQGLDITPRTIYGILGRLRNRHLISDTDGLVRLTNQEEEFFN